MLRLLSRSLPVAGAVAAATWAFPVATATDAGSAAPVKEASGVDGRKLMEGDVNWRDVSLTVADEKVARAREQMEDFIVALQDEICSAVAEVDGNEFDEVKWARGSGHGGGRSRVLQDGAVFEKAGVGVSIISGKLTAGAAKQMRSRGRALGEAGGQPFYACGLSLVMHPHNPMAPTVHANFRMFLVTTDDDTTLCWFGGGSDLTPAYLFEEDAIHFHRTYKAVCDEADASYYPRFKRWCDDYFYIKHRQEARGVGGIFFDDLENDEDPQQVLQFVKAAGSAFVNAYLPIVQKRKDMPFTEEQKQWQALRRGRYVEFNLVYDRGTKFGLLTPGSRVESILMSLPLKARWEYEHFTKPGSDEDKMQFVLKQPVDWIKKGEALALKEVSVAELLAELARRSEADAEAAAAAAGAAASEKE